MAKPETPQEKIEKIIALRQQGYNQKEIQKITGVSKKTISRICEPFKEAFCERKEMPWWFYDFKLKWDAMRASLGKT